MRQGDDFRAAYVTVPVASKNSEIGFTPVNTRKYHQIDVYIYQCVVNVTEIIFRKISIGK